MHTFVTYVVEIRCFGTHLGKTPEIAEGDAGNFHTALN